MVRPLRIEYPGALYHVTSRGDGGDVIYLDNQDRIMFIELLAEVCQRCHWLIHAYCLMGNHYHLLVETPEANLSRGMRQLNGTYTQRFNRRHHRMGHVFQGRYKAILVQKERYLLELCRYIVLNPVRAGIVNDVEAWAWSSYCASIGKETRPKWLEIDWLLTQFGNRRKDAVKTYIAFVHEGLNKSGIMGQVRYQSFLGDDDFMGRFQGIKCGEELNEISKNNRRIVTKTLLEYSQSFPNRGQAMANAYLSGAYTMKEIGEYFGVHYMTVSRAVHNHESKNGL